MAKLSDKRSNRVFLSLGSNQGDRLLHLKSAVELLKQRVGPVGRISHVYVTEAWGNKEMLPFFNLAIEIFTKYNPIEFLKKTQEIETALGRKSKTSIEYENRVIDIDILWFQNELVELDFLVIPHPQLKNRKFVLMPLNEIASELIIGNKNQTVQSFLKACDDKGKVLKLSLLK